MMSGAFLCQRKPGDDAIGGARVLDLEHRALAGLIRAVFRLRDHAVEARALESLQPFGGDVAIARHRCEIDRRRRRLRAAVSSASTPLALRAIHDRRAIDRQQVEADERRGHVLRQLLDARCGRVQPQLQRIEVRGRRRARSRSRHRPRIREAAVRAGPRAAPESSDRAASDRGSGCRRRRCERKTIERNPSHLGSNSRPSVVGMSSTSFASIGSMGGFTTGRSGYQATRPRHGAIPKARPLTAVASECLCLRACRGFVPDQKLICIPKRR